MHPPAAELSNGERSELPIGGMAAEKKTNAGGLYEAPGHDIPHQMYTPPVELPSGDVNENMTNHHRTANGFSSNDQPYMMSSSMGDGRNSTEKRLR
jgi:hypothetical protein